MYSITLTFTIIFLGAAVLSALALYTRQPIIVAYIVLGVLLGPHVTGWITDLALIRDAGHIGIVFLLFLLGLDMQPRALWLSLKSSAMVAAASSLVFLLVTAAILIPFQILPGEALIAGVALMFSSTILGIKLLPTSVLHHRHLGELMVGILLVQDVLAVATLLAIDALGVEGSSLLPLIKPLITLPLFILFCFGLVRWVLIPLLNRFDHYTEFLFLLPIGWCLGAAEIAHIVGLSAEIGAFIAGIVIATSPIAQYIALQLKPLRDFFLVIFFFAVGAQFDLTQLSFVWAPALVLSAALLALKPTIYQILLKGVSESPALAWNLGIRLGQCSEFSLLISILAFQLNLISESTAALIQATTIITLIFSSYSVVFYLPNPIAVSSKLRRD